MFVLNLHRKTAYLFFYSDIRVIINKIIKHNKQNEKNDCTVFLFRNKHHCQFVITVFSSVKRLFSSLIESNRIEFEDNPDLFRVSNPDSQFTRSKTIFTIPPLPFCHLTKQTNFLQYFLVL